MPLSKYLYVGAAALEHTNWAHPRDGWKHARRALYKFSFFLEVFDTANRDRYDCGERKDAATPSEA